jgi:hypothetical protein
MANSDWNINSDIYDIVSNINDLQKRYIEDEDETTLSLGPFGFISDVEAKKIQTSIVMTGQLGNEMFATRAMLTKNVLTHAAYNGISDINATPAKITITLCTKVSDILNNCYEDGCFYFDHMSPIYIGNIEFHFDYDIKITKRKINGVWSYSAQYVVTDEDGKKIVNRLSDITNPYLKQPFIINLNNEQYLAIQADVRQCTIEETYDSMTSDSIIENKSYMFTFENELADFNIVVTDGDDEVELTPYIYGMAIDPDVDKYCWYLYASSNTIRITFDSKSYTPGTNSKIYIKSYTTLGSEGNFNYVGTDGTSQGIYIDIESDTYSYYGITCFLVAVTDSTDGSNRKTKEELQKLIPKAALSRGSITTETDVRNYFNLIDNEQNRLVMQKKVDNQLSRVWYGYFMLKDDAGNLIPTNTINIRLVLNDNTMVKCNDGRYILPAGSVIKYDVEKQIGFIIDDSDVPVLYSDSYYSLNYYYYMTVYNIVLCKDPLYTAFYLTICNYDSYFVYDYVNDESELQFIANRFHFERKLLIDQDTYKMTFNIAQSNLDIDFATYTNETYYVTDENGNKIQKTVTTQNVRAILVLYDSAGNPYRWKECDLYDYSNSSKIFYFSTEITTDSMMDDLNRIKICGMNAVNSKESLYGYVDENVQASLYIIAKVATTSEDNYPRKDLDNIAPGYEDYVVTNIYNCVNGLQFIENFTNIMDSKVEDADTSGTTYTTSAVPVVGRHYMNSETNVKYLIEEINERRAYITYCLKLLENSLNIDFKYYNTYGPSITYTLEDGKTSIGAVDLTMRFKLSLKDDTDVTTKQDITNYIKSYIEDLYETGDLHIPNLITDIINEYKNRINYIEFVGFNLFDADDQHIVLKDVEDPTTVPEFLNIRNTKDVESGELVPYIDIKVV